MSVAIVGGGPAGMMLGLLLARAGIEVTLLEKHGDFLRDFRGDTVHPSTLQLLDELGLIDRFLRLPQSRLNQVAFPLGQGQGGWARRAGGREERSVVVADFARLKAKYPYVAMVPQWDLLNLLAETASAEPNFTLLMRHEVKSFLRSDGRVVGVGGDFGEVRADLTVACDGRWSLAHGLKELHTKEFAVPLDAWWFRLPSRESDTQNALTPRAGKGRFALVIPREGFLQLAYIAPKGSDAALRARGIEAFRRDIAEIMPELADRVDELESMDDVKHLDVRVNRLHRWHTDGLLCIGDAAHAMSPVGGVGINLAIQDAVAAATLLAPALRKGGPVDPALLARVRSRRLLPTAAVQLLQRVMHRVLVAPILEGRRMGPPAPALALLRRLPAASYVPAYLIGIGIRAEHAPAFARE